MNNMNQGLQGLGGPAATVNMQQNQGNALPIKELIVQALRPIPTGWQQTVTPQERYPLLHQL